MPAEIKIVIVDDTPTPSRTGGGGGSGTGDGGSGGGSGGGGAGGTPEDREQRRQYAFRVREGVKRTRQEEAGTRSQYDFRVRDGVRQKRDEEKKAKQEEDDKRRQYAFRVREGVKKQKEDERAESQKKKETIARRKEEAREDKRREAEQEAQQTRNAQLAVAISNSSKASGPGRFAAKGQQAGAIVGGALGGPAGAAIGSMVGEAIGKKVDDPVPEITAAWKFLSNASEIAAKGLVKIAGNEVLGAVQVGADTVADAFEGIPLVGASVSAAFGTLSKSLGAASAVVGAFTQRAQELGKYSGAIAGAFARRDVALVKADIRESQNLGEPYARLIEKLTVFELMGWEFLEPFKNIIVTKLPMIMDGILTAAINILEGMGRVDDTAKKMAAHLKVLRERAEAEARAGADILTPLLDAIDRLPGPGLGPVIPRVDRVAPPPLAMR